MLSFLLGKKIGDVELKNFMPRELNSLASRFNVKRETEKHLESTQHNGPAYIRECYLRSVCSASFFFVFLVEMLCVATRTNLILCQSRNLLVEVDQNLQL